MVAMPGTARRIGVADLCQWRDPNLSVFLQTSAGIALAPASSRIFVRFKDSGW
jgi:hypothetical protein